MKEKIESGQQASVKNIKNYIHLHLGCEGRVSIDYGPPMRGMKIVDCVLIGIVGEIVTLECYDISGNKWDAEHICHYNRFKPILRPLSSLEGKEKEWYGDRREFDALEFLYLLKQGFDLFGLIESGLAIDKTKLTTHV